MTDDDERAIAWVGQQSQRVMTWSGVPFIVTGFAAMVPAFFLAEWLFGSVKVSAVLACLPPVGLVLVGMKASEQTIHRTCVPAKPPT